MKVTTTSLQMLQPPRRTARPLPDGARLERAVDITPEYARFLYPTIEADGTHVEILYFGLAGTAIGLGLGGPLLQQGIAHAWSLPGRYGLPAAVRAWVHTCSLDGPAALPNYEARGLVVYRTETADQDVPDVPLGTWASLGGPSARVVGTTSSE